MHRHARPSAQRCERRGGLFWIGLIAALCLLNGRHRFAHEVFGALRLLWPALLVLALIGPAWSLIVGLIGSAWRLVVVGLIGLAWRLASAGLIVPAGRVIRAGLDGARSALARARAPTPTPPASAQGTRTATLDVGQTLAWLDGVIAAARPHLTPEMNARLCGVRASIAEVLPLLLGPRRSDADLFTVRETVLRYLPETLGHYIALPPVFRTTHLLSEGKTAQQLLSEQLALLDGKMREVSLNLARADAEALLANGRFLQARFAQPDFLAPAADAQGPSP